MNLVPLAQRIKARRLELGWTLDQVAAASGLTRSFLSKVENFRVTPSLPSLVHIARALQITMSQLVEGLDERPAMIIVRKNERQTLRRDNGDSPMTYFALAHKRPGKAMEPFLLEIPAGRGREKKLAHEGEEFLMILEGELDYWYGDEQYHFQAGDCFYDDGNVPHALRNPGSVTTRVLVVYSGLQEPGRMND